MRILLADARTNVRFALRALLRHRIEAEVVGETASAGELTCAVERHRPELLLLDWDLPGLGTDMLPRLRRICPELYVIVLGVRAEARVSALMAGADAFCMPSRTEGYGLVFLEAMAVGTPVIGCRVGGTRELIRHGTNGLLAAPGNAGDLARLLLEVHRDLRLRGRLKQEGRRTVELHSIDGMVQETLAVYRDLGLARSRRRRRAVLGVG